MSESAPPAAPSHGLPLAAILAGGESRRFGAPKLLATVGGRRLVDRARGALEALGADPVLIANQGALGEAAGLPFRSDLRPGGGPLAGIHAALVWAAERQLPGALVVACDMPFLEPRLLARLVEESREPGVTAVVPRNPARGGVEPLCAWYAPAALEVADRCLHDERRSLQRFVAALRARLLPEAEVARYGDPEVLFLNVNSRSEHQRAERIAQQRMNARAGS